MKASRWAIPCIVQLLLVVSSASVTWSPSLFLSWSLSITLPLLVTLFVFSQSQPLFSIALYYFRFAATIYHSVLSYIQNYQSFQLLYSIYSPSTTVKAAPHPPLSAQPTHQKPHAARQVQTPSPPPHSEPQHLHLSFPVPPPPAHP